jgi:hypothetical protein
LLRGPYQKAAIYFLQSIEAQKMFACHVAINIDCLRIAKLMLPDRGILSIAIMGLLVLPIGLSSCADNAMQAPITDLNKANVGA